MSEWSGRKRFYKEVSILEEGEGFFVTLDGRKLKSPSGNEFKLTIQPLIDAIVVEWRDQGEQIAPDTMPMFKLAATAVDRMGPRRAEVQKISLKFAETDLLCYRADEPADLVARQKQVWQPILDWARDALSVDLAVTLGVTPVIQPHRALASLADILGRYDDFELTAISSAAAASGSILLALALDRGHLNAGEMAESALLDELHQAERWGLDDEAKARHDLVRADIRDAERFLALYRS